MEGVTYTSTTTAICYKDAMMFPTNRPGQRSLRVLSSLVTAVAFAVMSDAAHCADDFPVRPVRFVLTYGAPGGTPDIIGRTVGAKLTQAWGRQVVVDPRPGGGGILAAEIVAAAAPDGYTILLVSPSHLINGALHAKLSYDPLKSFAPITQVADVPNILSVHPSLAARSVKELIALAKASPGALSYGSAGTGSSQHLSGELFKKMTGVDIVHVPYKVASAAVIDLLAGRIHVMFASNSSLPQIRAGRIVGLAVTSAKRSAALPDLPTVAESGVPGYEAAGWYGIVAPARTPAQIVNRIRDTIAKMLLEPQTREQLAVNTIDVIISPAPAAFGRFLEKENVKWGSLVRESGAKID
jgi:tripartite-type tricarboxylate transporter receptor subunit TctC